MLFTSTPNGTVAEGKFFYEMWGNAIDSEELFNLDDTIVENSEDILNSPTKNSFIKIKYHWSEDETKTTEWYTEQKKELNFNSRSINQELDLMFIGSTSCIFEDDFLAKLQVSKPKYNIKLSHFSNLKLYSDLDPNQYYIIGVDTAKSLTGDYCAVEIYEYNTFNQVGEFFNRLGSLTKFTDIVKEIIKFIAEKTNNRILLAIENNSIGTAIIENLENASNDKEENFDYTEFIFSNNKDEFKYGISTNSKSKDQMVTIFYDYVVSDPSLIKSSDLIDQFSVIEKRSNGSVAAKSGQHDDLFMASCFCAYAKKQTILEAKYLPLNSTEKIKTISEDQIFIDNVIPSLVSKKYTSDLNIFSSERELIKSLDDFGDDFVF